MILSLNNLKAGLRWWHKEFPPDIINGEYYEIYSARSRGVTGQWWTTTVDRLGRWRAYRGPKPPNTKAAITSRGAARLSAVAAQYATLITCSPAEPSIADRSWEDVAGLFALASDIKPGPPVFASKMCHFIFPRLFIPMDNLATSVFEYEFYWRGMKDEWPRFAEKAEAKDFLAGSIKSSKPVHPLYPWETKIMELSHIGYKHG